jgi:hypothetical protein
MKPSYCNMAHAVAVHSEVAEIRMAYEGCKEVHVGPDKLDDAESLGY